MCQRRGWGLAELTENEPLCSCQRQLSALPPFPNFFTIIVVVVVPTSSPELSLILLVVAA